MTFTRDEAIARVETLLRKRGMVSRGAEHDAARWSRLSRRWTSSERLADVPLLLLAQVAAQLHQLLEQLLDAPAASVVAVDERLELLGKVGACPVELDELIVRRRSPAPKFRHRGRPDETSPTQRMPRLNGLPNWELSNTRASANLVRPISELALAYLMMP
jgi:hypothetical protein